MITSFSIDGMSCQNCVAKVKKSISNVPGVNHALIQLEKPQAVVESNVKLDIDILSNALGKYHISPIADTSLPLQNIISDQKEISKLQTYKPLLLIVLFIFGTTLLAQFPFENFDAMQWMRHFMAGFFIVFSFFKLLNISGFANSYSMYDVIAKKWKSWGYIYPFIELTLGILYLTNVYPRWTHLLTIALLSIGTIGVIQSNLKKDKIQCACLGDVFDLPMSTITIVENVTMILMAMAMLFLL